LATTLRAKRDYTLQVEKFDTQYAKNLPHILKKRNINFLKIRPLNRG
jgi:hypothetical protein